MRTEKHKYLVIPGPVEVRPEILDAQGQWMIGHRSNAFAELYARLQGKLRQAFFTQNCVFVMGSSGTGLWEGASRNCIRDDKKALHLVGGAFSQKWAEVAAPMASRSMCWKSSGARRTRQKWSPMRLKKATDDAVCVVHNETSTGVTNPIRDRAGRAPVRRHAAARGHGQRFPRAIPHRRVGHRLRADLLAEGVRAAAGHRLRRVQ